jgi:hypothetical protein
MTLRFVAPLATLDLSCTVVNGHGSCERSLRGRRELDALQLWSKPLSYDPLHQRTTFDEA